MYEIARGAVVAVVLASLTSGPAYSATQLVLGRKFQVKNPYADPSRRKVSGQAQERESTNTVIGDPTVNGATLVNVWTEPRRPGGIFPASSRSG